MWSVCSIVTAWAQRSPSTWHLWGTQSVCGASSHPWQPSVIEHAHFYPECRHGPRLQTIIQCLPIDLNWHKIKSVCHPQFDQDTKTNFSNNRHFWSFRCVCPGSFHLANLGVPFRMAAESHPLELGHKRQWGLRGRLPNQKWENRYPIWDFASQRQQWPGRKNRYFFKKLFVLSNHQSCLWVCKEGWLEAIQKDNLATGQLQLPQAWTEMDKLSNSTKLILHLWTKQASQQHEESLLFFPQLFL